jgi:hypothetical protein
MRQPLHQGLSSFTSLLGMTLGPTVGPTHCPQRRGQVYFGMLGGECPMTPRQHLVIFYLPQNYLSSPCHLSIPYSLDCCSTSGEC